MVATAIQVKVIKINPLQPWLVCLSAALFFFYEFIQMGMFNSLAPELMRDFNITATQLGNLSATYFYADVAFLLFAGILLDRFSVRRIILTALVSCITATVIFALSTSVLMAGASHFIAGVGNAFCFLSCIKLSSQWFTSRQLALVIGTMVTLAMLGGVVAQTPLTLLAQLVGWRHAVMGDAILGVLILGLAWYFIEDKPRLVGQNVSAQATQLGLKQSLNFAVRNLQNWLGGLYTCLLNLPVFLLGALWGVMYLTHVHHLPRAQASYVTSMIFIGTIIGSPLVGWISDRIEQRRLPMLIGAGLSLIVILIIMFMPNLTLTALLGLFLLLGIFSSTQIISYPLIAESNPKAITGTATSLASVLIMGGGAVFQPLFGWLMDLHVNHLVTSNIAVYSQADLMRGMAIFPIAFIISLITAVFIRETQGKL